MAKSKQNPLADQEYAFTKIPNSFLDLWMCQLDPISTVILIFLYRKTLGYQKTTDTISLSQISKGTNINRRSVIRHLSTLESKMLIKRSFNKSSSGDKDSNTYEIIIPKEVVTQSHYLVTESHQVVTESHIGSDTKSLGVVTQSHIQKKTLQKKLKKQQQQVDEVVDTLDFSLEASSSRLDDSHEIICKRDSESMYHLLRNKSCDFGSDWLIPTNVLFSLSLKYGSSYLLDQINHMISKQEKALKLLNNGYKAKFASPVRDPEAFLKYACSKNSAESIHGLATIEV